MDLNAAKILVVLVIALVVLGPDKLPKVAHQAGRLFNDFRHFRDGLHAEVREAFGDPQAIAGLPGHGKAWMDSVTAEVLSVTGTAENPSPQGGPMPGGASSQAPPGSGPLAEVGSRTDPHAEPVTGVGLDEADGRGFDRGFN